MFNSSFLIFKSWFFLSLFIPCLFPFCLSKFCWAYFNQRFLDLTWSNSLKLFFCDFLIHHHFQSTSASFWSLPCHPPCCHPQDRRRRIAAGCRGRGVCIRCSDVGRVWPSGTNRDNHLVNLRGLFFLGMFYGNYLNKNGLFFGMFWELWTIIIDYDVIFFGGSANPSDHSAIFSP